MVFILPVLVSYSYEIMARGHVGVCCVQVSRFIMLFQIVLPISG